MLNLVLPGGGLVLAGFWVAGLAAGLLFAAAANFLLAATLLFPDDFSHATRGLGVIVLAAIYTGAQFRMGQARRRADAGERGRRRRQALIEAQAALATGDARRALASLHTIGASHEEDLLVCVRLAEAFTLGGDLPEAERAWRRVAALDRHGLYREQVRAAAARLRGAAIS